MGVVLACLRSDCGSRGGTSTGAGPRPRDRRLSRSRRRDPGGVPSWCSRFAIAVVRGNAGVRDRNPMSGRSERTARSVARAQVWSPAASWARGRDRNRWGSNLCRRSGHHQRQVHRRRGIRGGCSGVGRDRGRSLGDLVRGMGHSPVAIDQGGPWSSERGPRGSSSSRGCSFPVLRIRRRAARFQNYIANAYFWLLSGLSSRFLSPRTTWVQDSLSYVRFESDSMPRPRSGLSRPSCTVEAAASGRSPNRSSAGGSCSIFACTRCPQTSANCARDIRIVRDASRSAPRSIHLVVRREPLRRAADAVGPAPPDAVVSPAVNCLDADAIGVQMVFAKYWAEVRCELSLHPQSSSIAAVMAPSSLYLNLIRRLERHAYTGSALLWSLSETDRRELEDRFGRPTRRSPLPPMGWMGKCSSPAVASASSGRRW